MIIGNRWKNLKEQKGENFTKKIELDEVAFSDLYMIHIGAYDPLKGFMVESDYKSCLDNMRLSNGEVWSLPIVLPASREEVQNLLIGDKVQLSFNQFIYGEIEVADIYKTDQVEEVKKVFLTDDLNHPGVRMVFDRKSYYVGGKIFMKQNVRTPFHEYPHTPKEIRKFFEKKGWKTIVGFQTRNPIHRAHEYLQKCALETVDGLFIHPLVGKTKADDIPPEVRMKSYEILIDQYYPKDRVLLGVFPASMRYAGPREALFHAIVRRNYGCTHFVVGRDHAGVGNFYGTYDAQRIFQKFTLEELGITPLYFEHSFYCKECQQVASLKTCPHNSDSHIIFSGTKVRELLRKGIIPPKEFTRKEVAEVLIAGMKKYKSNER
ncbi:sulfate adenylyltransferase [Fictibacillus arsenicus]|uniref:sulfate adenylyltransferase n=1 Tax=Fictibacillus arsenicus TaxID=255247 RepID=UPI0007CBA62B